jgi:hypothetical protein
MVEAIRTMGARTATIENGYYILYGFGFVTNFSITVPVPVGNMACCWKIIFSLLISALLFSNYYSLKDIICHDPDAGGTIQNKDRKFLILGSSSGGGAGLGNILIFYPAAFYFAAVTGRDIIISDSSVIGEMCSIIQCGFPFVSQLALAFPNILNNDTLARVDEIKAIDFGRYSKYSLNTHTQIDY